MPSSTRTTYTRVAVVQLAYHPAALVDRRSPLEDPLFDSRGGPDTLLPRGDVPDAIAADLAALRARVRNAHNDQLLAKLRAVLEACSAWGVQLVVLPEYSVPWEILGGIADAAGDMVVVAGTHAVDRAARKSGVYERLSAPTLPVLGQAVCPVLHKRRLLAIQPKLNPALPERGSMKTGEVWAPVAMPAGIVGPLGVLVCLDFLYRESEAHQKLVAANLEQCRFLAVPSLTPRYTLPEFEGKAWEEARRYGRPVLYSDTADGGGTAIYVDEGQPYDLRRFPERAGLLDPGDEGVIVADVNLGYERPGGSTRYAEARPVLPVAEASFVYKSHPVGRAYAEWLEEARPLLGREDDDALEALDAMVHAGRATLLNVGALIGATARGRRLKKLLADIDRVTRVEEIRQFTREVVLPDQLLPLRDVRRAMAVAAADVVFEWMKRPEVRAAGFGEVETRLRQAASNGARWPTEAEAAVTAIVRAIKGEEREAGKVETFHEVRTKVVMPSGVDPAALGVQKQTGWVLSFKARPFDLGERLFDEEDSVQTRKMSSSRTDNILEYPMRFSAVDLDALENVYWLAQTEGGERCAVVAAWQEQEQEHEHRDYALFALAEIDGRWIMYTTSDLHSNLHGISVALEACGINDPVIIPLSKEELVARVAILAPSFDGARDIVRSLRDERLRDVENTFVEPDASFEGGANMPALVALEVWLSLNAPSALVLGEFGVGKSTVLAEWAHRRWGSGQVTRPLLVSLAGAGPTAVPAALLLRSAGLARISHHGREFRPHFLG